MKLLLEKVHLLLHITRVVCHVSMRAGFQREDLSLLGVQQADVDLVIVEVGSDRQQRIVAEQTIGMQVLRIDPLLQARVMLLDFISMNRIVQEEGEIRVEIEKRSAHKAIHFQDVSVHKVAFVVSAEGSQANSPAIIGINVAEAVKLTSCDKV